MCNKLEKAEEIAIDLEHHAYRTYQGFTCLLQISTRDEDFIVDTLVLRRELSILNKTFTNPKIVKVLHGSDNDILWLQRDFGVYIVNLFDTGQAARTLEYPKFALSYLLFHFCGLSVEKKKFQLADWRIRPVPEEMIDYARSDTHYLLYIYDRLQNELLEKGKIFLTSTLNLSKDICKRAYSKDIFQPTLLSIQRKCPAFNPTQTSVLSAIFEWRDFFAREEDESVRYILPNHMMIRIAELLPQEPIELLSCCNPQPPPFVKANASDLIQIIKDTIENKRVKITPSRPISVLPPLQSQNSTLSKQTVENLTEPKNLQDEVFQLWCNNNTKRTASLDSTNQSSSTFSPSSTSANFFSSPKKSELKNDKLSSVKNSLSSSLTPSSVPTTMEEIYQFSNANRKRNKEKKKLKEDSIKAGPVSPIKFGDE